MKMLDKPCARCGWKYPGDHVCIDMSTPELRRAAQRVVVERVYKKRVYTAPKSEAQLEQARSNLSEHWAAIRAENAPRDAKLVDRYNEGGIGQKQLSREFGIAQSTVGNILRRAQDRGETIIRGRGLNIRHGYHEIKMEEG